MAKRKKKSNKFRQEKLIIVRDEDRILKLKKYAQALSFVGMAILLGGLVFLFVGEDSVLRTYAQLISLTVGYLISQIGLYLSHRYLKLPRPDEVLDKALKKDWQKGRIYHYTKPAPHILLNKSGLVLLIPKFQKGKISAEGSKWRQKGIGMRGFFGQEKLNNPSLEAHRYLSRLGGYLKKAAPEIADKEIPVGLLIVFTHADRNELDIAGSDMPAIHFSKLGAYLRQHVPTEPLPKDDYVTLQRVFDNAAGLD